MEAWKTLFYHNQPYVFPAAIRQRPNRRLRVLKDGEQGQRAEVLLICGENARLFEGFGVMAHIGTLDEEHNIFGNIRGVIRDTLKIAGDKHQVDTTADG
jgi:hypothetical protein